MRKVFTVSFHGFETVKQNLEKNFYAIIFSPSFFKLRKKLRIEHSNFEFFSRFCYILNDGKTEEN